MEIAKPPKQQYFISKSIDSLLIQVAKVYGFFSSYFREVVRPPYEWAEIARQSYQIGCKTLPLITLTSFIVGMVFTQQSRPSLAEFGATSWLPSLVGIAIVRALAPLVTALICAGKIGSGIGAELGSMKVTEQIDAMEVSASNPYKYLVVTRVTASTLMIPLLMLYTAFVGLMGSFINVNRVEHTSFTTYFTEAFEQLSFLDMSSSLAKAITYGFTIGMVASYKGFNTIQGTEGVGKAANSAVVVALYLIFLEEMLIVQVVSGLR